MSFFKSINTFIKSLDKKKFTYKDGFFEMPYMAGSPEMTVKSFDKFYFTKHNKKDNKIDVKNIFMHGAFYYLKLEDGLWIYVSRVQYKKNIQFYHYYQENDTDNYYFLNFNQHLKTISSKKMVVNGLCISNQSWVLFKPLVAKSICHFKDTEELNVTINFNQAWLDKQLNTNELFIKSNISSFINSEAKFLSWPFSEKEEISFHHFFECIHQKEPAYEEKLKNLTSRTFDLFLKKHINQKITENDFQFSDADRKKIQIANQYMLDNICGKSITIDMICDKIGMSSTKFKILFKKVYGNSVYQYYRDKKLEYAHDLIKKSESTITEIANYIGYENTSKFTIAYKQKFGALPSNVN